MGVRYAHCRVSKTRGSKIVVPFYQPDDHYGEKFCSQCRNWLPASKEFFYSNVSKADGLSTECKQCGIVSRRGRREREDERRNVRLSGEVQGTKLR